MSGEADRRRRAVALRYAPGKDEAPTVVASGAGLIAEHILELAREHGVHIHEDPSLAAVLGKLDVGLEIPSELYHAIAEVLAFIYRTDQRAAERYAEAQRPPE